MASKTATATETAKQKRPAYSWTQPVCADCWGGLQLKTGRRTDDHSTAYTCCFCWQGLDGDDRYMIRVNPGSVPYPTIQKETYGTG